MRKTFPGPPNYESVKKGDKAETYWLLDLLTPVCVDVDPAEPELDPAQKGVHQTQLVVQPEQYKRYKPLVGMKVIATGTLFGQITAHHRTPVLLTLHRIEKAPK